MGTVNDYASTKCPLFGLNNLGVGAVELYDCYAPFRIGASGTPIELGTSGEKLLSVYATSARTSGDQMAGYFEYHITGNRCEGQAIRAILELDAQGGGSEEAIYAIADMNAQGYVSGNLTAVRAQLNLPTVALEHGTFSALQAELAVPTGCDNIPSNKTSIARFGAGGDAVAHFRSYGFLFEVTGMGAASSATNIFHTTGEVSGTHGLRILIDGVQYDILLKASTYG